MDPKRKKHHWSSNKHSAKIYFGLPSICFEVIVILLQFRVRVHTFTMQTRFQTILNNSFFSSHVWRKRFMHYLEKIFLQIYLYERGPKKLREFEKEGKQPLQLHSYILQYYTFGTPFKVQNMHFYNLIKPKGLITSLQHIIIMLHMHHKSLIQPYLKTQKGKEWTFPPQTTCCPFLEF